MHAYQMVKINSTIRWYNQNAQKFANLVESQQPVDYLSDFLELLPPSPVILDAGCGSGRDSVYFNHQGCQLTGLDLSTELLKIAKKRCPSCSFVLGDLRNLPFPDNSFDGVWAQASLLHLRTNQDVTKALQEFARVVKKNGIIHVFVRGHISGKKVFSSKFLSTGDQRLFHNFTVIELTKLIESAGFKLIKIEQYLESDRQPNGRPNIAWIRSLGRKL